MARRNRRGSALTFAFGTGANRLAESRPVSTADFVGVMYAGKLMEVAPAQRIFNNPLHPYTKALLAANPTVASFMESAPAVLKGEVDGRARPADRVRAQASVRRAERNIGRELTLRACAGIGLHREPTIRR
jgi:oligopeptide/dipeptide ABC transporter ATP-binding protein